MGQEQSAAANSNRCKPCGAWSQQAKEQNTVKVDTNALSSQDKENARPANGKSPVPTKEDEERQRQREEWERRQEEARRAEEQRREMERRVQEEQERLQQEQRKREEERRRLQLEQEQLKREAEAEQKRQEAEYRRQEEARQKQFDEEQRRKKAEDAEKKRKLQEWLKTNGFKTVDELVRKRMSKVRPLHHAVQIKNVEMVEILLWAGADRRLTNGNKQTAFQLASKLDKAGSHKAVIGAFSTPNQPA